MTYEKLNDHLDKKIADFNLKALAFIGGILLKPLATATEPFFRKNMGERYFTSGVAVLGFFFWLMVQALSGLCMGLVTRNRSQMPEDMHDFLVHFCLTFVLSFTYMFMAIWNLGAATYRQKKGMAWHSLSRGQSIFGSENTIRDVAIAVLITLVLFHFEPVIAFFFAASRIVSYYTAAQERASIYARYLDAMDAQIEAQHLERALRDGEPPRITEGLYGPLPKRFKGEHRAYVARVVAGGGAARAVGEEQQPPGNKHRPTQKAVPATRARVSAPAVVEPISQHAPSTQATAFDQPASNFNLFHAMRIKELFAEFKALMRESHDSIQAGAPNSGIKLQMIEDFGEISGLFSTPIPTGQVALIDETADKIETILKKYRR